MVVAGKCGRTYCKWIRCRPRIAVQQFLVYAIWKNEGWCDGAMVRDDDEVYNGAVYVVTETHIDYVGL